MADDMQQARLASLKRQQRAVSSREKEMSRLFAAAADGVEDKIAVIKTMQQLDKSRIVSAVARMIKS